MYKSIVILFLLALPVLVSAADFIHPLDFKGTQAEKAQVINYIEQFVKTNYAQIGMDDPSTLRMMEREELESFKQLTKVENRKLLDGVIAQYCSVGMCNYSTIMMMYNEQLSASKESLKW